MHKTIEAALSGVPNLDEDRTLRRYVNAIDATLRTNYFQKNTDGTPRDLLAFKFDPKHLDGLPDPRPFREIFVYGTEVEGVHLRFGKVARGGLRWSDRGQDYRTEVLGLVKAQQVKNAVIVPVGAKGGFFPKNLPVGGSRDEVFNAGREAYKTYIRTLLSITDNIVDDKIVHPEKVVIHDGDDPYFVVAADKGTATFSDIANEIALQHEGLQTGFYTLDALSTGDPQLVRDVLEHAVLPAIALGLLTGGIFLRLVRTNVIGTLNTGYVEAARSRGVNERRLLRKHAWRPALVPIITVIGLQVALLLGGAVLTETTFEWKGLGFQLIEYVNARDFVAVQGMVVLLAVIVALTNFVVDIIAALVDPRIRF